MPALNTQSLYKKIKVLIEESRKRVAQTINIRIVETYYNIGKLIIKYEQQGKSRAQYAEKTLQNLSLKLTKTLGRGFSVDNLENMRKFYLLYTKSEIVSRKSANINFGLSWSHYVFLIRIEKTITRYLQANTKFTYQTKKSFSN